MPKQKGAGSKVKTSRHSSQDENVLILNYTNSVKQRVLLFLNLLVTKTSLERIRTMQGYKMSVIQK